MIWEPFLLAVAFGLVVSAAIYFVAMWPQVEPPDDDVDVDGVAEAAPGASAGDGGDPPARS